MMNCEHLCIHILTCSILHLLWSFPPFSSSFAMRAWHPNDKNDSWSRLSSEGTYTQRLIHTNFLPPPSSDLIYQSKTHRALRTHKEQACQHGHSLAWQQEGQMALNHTSSSGHLIKRQVCVRGRDPNRQTTQLFQHPSIESQWCPLLPPSSSANDQTWHLQTKYSPTHPARVTPPLSTDRLSHLRHH